MALRIVTILFPLLAITTLGFVVARRRVPDLAEANRLNMDVFTPCLVFGALAGREVQVGHYLRLAAGGLVVIVVSGLAGWALARALGLVLTDRRRARQLGTAGAERAKRWDRGVVTDRWLEVYDRACRPPRDGS